MSKFKLQNSLEKTNYIKILILKAICLIKENVIDYQQHKLNQQLINDTINFIVSTSTFVVTHNYTINVYNHNTKIYQ